MTMADSREIARKGGVHGPALAAGAIAGAFGGFLMAALGMAYGSWVDTGFWLPAKVIAATVLGVEAMVGGPATVALGLILHLAVTAALGAVFAALLARSATSGAALALGFAFAAVVYATVTWAVLPWANPTMKARVDLTPAAFFAQHLLFGAALGLVPHLRRRLGGALRPAGTAVAPAAQ